MLLRRDTVELKVSSPNNGGLSPSDHDPEENEISDDDDDDRNHKHRRRETQSQSMERDALEQVLVRPYRKRNKPYENGHTYREIDTQSCETYKGQNAAALDKEQYGKFEKRRPGLATFMRASNRLNQSSSAEFGPGRCKGREPGSWNQQDPRLSSADIAYQLNSSLFAGQGLPNVSNSKNASWNAFGLISGSPNGGLDTLHSLGLQRTLRPKISNSLKTGIPRARCRDFEERGFCLRGDMCPMEHGVNRIIVEDVQSLQQFNLPIPLPSAHMLGTVPSVSASSSTLINGKNLNSKRGKTGLADDEVGLEGGCASSADFYDPDQPLWTNIGPETSTVILGLNPSKLSKIDAHVPESHNVKAFDGNDLKSAPIAVGSQSTNLSVWGRIGAKCKSDRKEKINSNGTSSNHVENETKEYPETLANLQGVDRQGKHIIGEDSRLQTVDSPLKIHGDTGPNIRKPSQKALRTLFVNGIPQKDNKKDALLSHFQKFGEVIDICIPFNSERAFVQFSKREEAEAALRAPDAVMGNRFIKLWWANRDSKSDDGMSSGNGAPIIPHGVGAVSIPSHLSVAHKGKNNISSMAPKISIPNASVAPVPPFDHTKHVATNSPKSRPLLHKKMENLELLKEQLRKKQELLDKKRNDFRRQLDKLGKQATGLKGEVTPELASKRQKVGTAADVAKDETPSSTNFGTVISSSQMELAAEKNKPGENVVLQNSKPDMIVGSHESESLKQSVCHLATKRAPFLVNRFKLDNRPTAFKIIPPLPTGLANVAVLKEHFSAYGELSTVELENVESTDSVTSKNCLALLSFTTRHSAERAFARGKHWQGHNLQFTWMPSTQNSNDNPVRENPAACKMSSDADHQPLEEVTPLDSQEVTSPVEDLDAKYSGGDFTQLEDLQSSPSASHDK
ncbi:hypothetical protein NMG60_11006691 [Bertholletia excelsa]